jgi:hypothetical protein
MVSYLALNLVWKPIKRHLRFIFVITSRGPLVLMCNDLSMDPLLALSLYCARVRVETLFAMLKGLLGTFAYRFWSKYVPRHSRKPKKNAALKPPPVQHLAEVHQTWQACEGFVMLGCIALGLLQLIALKFQGSIWAAFTRFLRTRRRALPSERTVKAVLAQELTLDFHSLKPSAMMREIHGLDRSPDAEEGQGHRHPKTEPQVPSA